jgi:hypothetical protein
MEHQPNAHVTTELHQATLFYSSRGNTYARLQQSCACCTACAQACGLQDTTALGNGTTKAVNKSCNRSQDARKCQVSMHYDSKQVDIMYKTSDHHECWAASNPTLGLWVGVCQAACAAADTALHRLCVQAQATSNAPPWYKQQAIGPPTRCHMLTSMLVPEPSKAEFRN